jgi:phosphatidylinositol glycan class B
VASKAEEKPASATLLPQDNDLNRLVNEQQAKDVWLMLLVFRGINAALVWTFFQPDEYFQSLEPAWQTAFGPQSGAWITWVSILPPAQAPGPKGSSRAIL